MSWPFECYIVDEIRSNARKATCTSNVYSLHSFFPIKKALTPVLATSYSNSFLKIHKCKRMIQIYFFSSYIVSTPSSIRPGNSFPVTVHILTSSDPVDVKVSMIPMGDGNPDNAITSTKSFSQGETLSVL